MDTKQHSIKKLTIRDFHEEDEKFYCTLGEYELVLWEEGGALAKRIIQIWLLEGDKKYLKEQYQFDWKMTDNKLVIKERNRRLWEEINKLARRYYGK